MNSIEVKGITVKYGSETILEKLFFKHQGNGLIQILGPNGAGKSTLLKTILGLLKPVEGRIIVNNVDVTGKPGIVGKYVGYVPQITGASMIDYPLTLYELVACCYVLKKKWPRIRLSHREHELVSKILEELGLPRDRWGRRVSELSGGERQRGYIARALVNDPPILLMDEPFSNIDPEGRVDIAEKIVMLSRKKLIIVTSHDPTYLLPYTDKILLLNRRTFFYGRPEDVLKKDIVKKIYGEAFVIVDEKHIHIVDSHV